MDCYKVNTMICACMQLIAEIISVSDVK